MGLENHTTMTAAQLEAGIAEAGRYPHAHVHNGDLIISTEAIENLFEQNGQPLPGQTR